MRSDHITEPVPPALSRGGNQRQPALSEAGKELWLGAPAKPGVLEEETWRRGQGRKGDGSKQSQTARECKRWQS